MEDDVFDLEETDIEEPKETFTGKTFSSIDKLPWNKKIELQMWITIRNSDKYHIYDKEVEKLEKCTRENFYGIDLATPISENIELLDKERSVVLEHFIAKCDNGVYYHPKKWDDLTFEDKDKVKKKIYFWYWDERFNKIRGLLAKHRALLYGKQMVPGGTQMRDE